MEDSDQIDALLQDSLKTTVEEVKQAFGVNDTLAVLDMDKVENFFENLNIVPGTQFKSALNTPFAIAKYITLLEESNDLIEKVKKDFDAEFGKDLVKYYFYTDFSNRVQICTKSDYKQSLVLQYTLNETKKFSYAIVSGNCTFNISLSTIKNLLFGTSSNNVFNIEPISLSFGNLEISIKAK